MAGAMGSKEEQREIGFGARQILICIAKLFLHVLGSPMKILFRKGTSYLFLKKYDQSRNGIGTNWNVLDKKFKCLNIAVTHSSVVCHFMACTVKYLV